MKSIPRRSLLQFIGSAGLMGLVTKREAAAEEAVAQATRATPTPKIKDISVIETAPGGVRLTVVKITTDQAGPLRLRLRDVHAARGPRQARGRAISEAAPARQDHGPHRGHLADGIQQLVLAERSGVLNNAISGVDQALWDIKGRQAGMPVYQLLGGKCREAADCYGHASRQRDSRRSSTSAKNYMAQGFRHVRVQVGVPGMAGYGAGAGRRRADAGTASRPGLRAGGLLPPRDEALRGVPQASSAKRSSCCTTSTSASRPTRACSSARTPRSSSCSSSRIRCRRRTSRTSARFASSARRRSRWASCSTARTSGRPLIAERLIDYIRIHVSQAGGLTPCRKIAAFAEQFGVKTAWHGPGDVSPIGHMANVTLDVACYNFGVQEYSPFNAEPRRRSSRAAR